MQLKKTFLDCATIMHCANELGMNALRLLLVVALRSNGGSCGCSLRTLAAAADCHETTATKYLRLLIAGGFIRESSSKGRTWRSVIASEGGLVEVQRADPMLALLIALADSTGFFLIERQTLMVMAGHMTANTMNKNLDHIRDHGWARIERSRAVLTIKLLPSVIPFTSFVSKIEGTTFARS